MKLKGQRATASNSELMGGNIGVAIRDYERMRKLVTAAE